MNVEQLAEINDSIRETRIAKITVADKEDHDRFLIAIQAWAECDYAEQSDAPTDIWGTTEAGDEFRIYLSYAG